MSPLLRWILVRAGRVRLLYVCDDPRLHLLHRWCAMHLSDEVLDISVISLRRNKAGSRQHRCSGGGDPRLPDEQ